MYLKRRAAKIKITAGIWFKQLLKIFFSKILTKQNVSKSISFVFSKKFIVGILTGFLLTTVFLHYQNISAAKQRVLNKNTLEDNTRILLFQNSFLLTEATKSLINNHTDYDAIVGTLDTNNLALSKQLEVIYGEEAVKPLFAILKKQDDAYLHYTSDMYGGFIDNAANDLPEITGFPEQISNYFFSINNKTDKQALKIVFGEYVSDLKTFIDSYLVRDFTTAYAKEKSLLEKSDSISAMLMEAAIKKHPDKFKN